MAAVAAKALADAPSERQMLSLELPFAGMGTREGAQVEGAFGEVHAEAGEFLQSECRRAMVGRRNGTCNDGKVFKYGIEKGDLEVGEVVFEENGEGLRFVILGKGGGQSRQGGLA